MPNIKFMQSTNGSGNQIKSVKKRQNVVAILPRGEVIRNFVYSGTLEEIARNAGLSLLTVSTNSPIDEYLTEKFGEIKPLIEYDEKWIVRFQRDILDIAHGRWLWSQAAQERWRRRDGEAKTIGRKVIRALKKSISRPLANKLGLRGLTKIERASSRLFNSTNFYLDLYRKIKPTLVFNGSHVHSRNAIQAVQAAQWLKIPTATFIFSWDNLTSQGRIMLPYDYYLVWNEALKKQLLEMYGNIREEQVFVTGTPQFDFHFQPKFYKSREEFCAEIGADPSRPIVLYSTGMANHMPGEQEIVEEIADILEEIASPDQPQLVVRVYPKDLTGRFEELRTRRKDILFPKIEWEEAWHTPKFEDTYSLVNTLRHAALGINVASTISLELCMFDKPVINVGYNPTSVSEDEICYADYYDFDHYRPIVDSGAIEVASDRGQMRELICRALGEPQRRKSERVALIKEMFGETLDGNSGRRAAQALLQMAEQSRPSRRKRRTWLGQ